MTDNKIEFADKSGAEIKPGVTVAVPFRVVAIEKSLLHLESVEAYGHEKADFGDVLKGRTRLAFWAEADQLKTASAEVGADVAIPFRVTKLGGSRSPLVLLETPDFYGRPDRRVKNPQMGRTRASFWAEPSQVEVAKS